MLSFLSKFEYNLGVFTVSVLMIEELLIDEPILT